MVRSFNLHHIYICVCVCDLFLDVRSKASLQVRLHTMRMDARKTQLPPREKQRRVMPVAPSHHHQ
ncbi:hypothetical protein BX666DRAFT_887814 [Dichotomocladium elegans]|nr:hypothetical protein BX666DRAFT_887814 [Dichotomocladium elegans]